MTRRSLNWVGRARNLALAENDGWYCVVQPSRLGLFTHFYRRYIRFCFSFVAHHSKDLERLAGPAWIKAVYSHAFYPTHFSNDPTRNGWPRRCLVRTTQPLVQPVRRFPSGRPAIRRVASVATCCALTGPLVQIAGGQPFQGQAVQHPPNQTFVTN